MESQNSVCLGKRWPQPLRPSPAGQGGHLASRLKPWYRSLELKLVLVSGEQTAVIEPRRLSLASRAPVDYPSCRRPDLQKSPFASMHVVPGSAKASVKVIKLSVGAQWVPIRAGLAVSHTFCGGLM